MSKRWPDTPPVYGDPQASAVAEAGGILLRAKLVMPPGQNGGCGAPTHVEGTNGGKMPCGALLTRFGKPEPYYCGLCYKEPKQ